jgi:hypothetical protein
VGAGSSPCVKHSLFVSNDYHNKLGFIRIKLIIDLTLGLARELPLLCGHAFNRTEKAERTDIGRYSAFEFLL